VILHNSGAPGTGTLVVLRKDEDLSSKYPPGQTIIVRTPNFGTPSTHYVQSTNASTFYTPVASTVSSASSVATPPSVDNSTINASITANSNSSPPSSTSETTKATTNSNNNNGNGVARGSSLLADDYQNYTMQRIITEALERSNVGCNNNSPSNNTNISLTSISSNSNSTGSESPENLMSRKRSPCREPVIENAEDQNNQNSATKRMKV
jgi:hypothetical protein